MWTWPLNHKTGIVQMTTGRCMSVTNSASQMHGTLWHDAHISREESRAELESLLYDDWPFLIHIDQTTHITMIVTAWMPSWLHNLSLILSSPVTDTVSNNPLVNHIPQVKLQCTVTTFLATSKWQKSYYRKVSSISLTVTSLQFICCYA